MRNFLVAALMMAAPAAHAAQVDDAEAIRMAVPLEAIVAGDIDKQRLEKITAAANAFYGFWNNGSQILLDKALSANFIDHTLPAGRPQGPAGPAAASRNFLAAVPDLKAQVVQRLVVGDRVVSHLRFTGHFTGNFMGKQGNGETVDFIATDILRVVDGKITDNWHLEDNLTFLQQIGLVPSN